MRKVCGTCGCIAVVVLAAWISRAGQDGVDPSLEWREVAPGVFRSPGHPAGYALVDGDAAILIDAPVNSAALAKHGVKTVEKVYLTHYHRASVAAVPSFLQQKVLVTAPKGADEWLSPKNVSKYWQEALPLRNSRTAYQIVPVGFDGIEYKLQDGDKITWRGWNLEVLDTPGHARVHVSFLARKGADGPVIAFVGGVMATGGKMWAPYTTDWDHWTDAGLTPAANSLRKLARLKPDILCPALGPVVSRNPFFALCQSAEAVEELAFLRSFERYTKKRLGNPPSYKFLAKEQAESNGSKPWSRISEHIYLTGNTYVLASKENACLMIDPWDKRSADQFAKLQKDKNLGPLEVVMFSHAHYDHYDGIYHLPDRGRFQVWSLDLVSLPLEKPFLLRAPFLDARPVKFDKLPKDGDSLTWREYRFKFHHLPGQSEFTMGVEATIDGKRCFFTADNFFHQDMFSGSGGWMGLNRSFPPLYAASAKKVLDAAPDWVLAEHGGPFEFNAEDFKRRVEWGLVSAEAADALSPTGNHLQDWNPHLIRVEPLVQKAKPGAKLIWTLVADNPLKHKQAWKVELEGRGVVADQNWLVEVAPGATARRDFSVQLPERLAKGRHIFILPARRGELRDGSDVFLGVDVE
ncbi:MAG: MBL fold metallo-hydrolase [Planctomycetes bacterium]|nr:MBL fold metallo-hydrolase [Planctomycetota bacterium]